MDEHGNGSPQGPRDWDLHLLNCWELRARGCLVPLGFREQRLIGFVGLHGRRLRSYIAGVLWPESTQQRAQGNLRAAVLNVQRAAPGMLEADRTTIGLRPVIGVDVHELCARLDHVLGTPDVDDVDGTIEALDGGDLMPGWYEDWVIFERERLDQRRVRAFERLAAAAIERGETDAAIAAARAAARIEPLRDSARSLEIRAHLAAGHVADAMRVYRAHAALLRDELGVEPSENVRALFATSTIGGSERRLATG